MNDYIKSIFSLTDSQIEEDLKILEVGDEGYRPFVFVTSLRNESDKIIHPHIRGHFIIPNGDYTEETCFHFGGLTAPEEILVNPKNKEETLETLSDLLSSSKEEALITPYNEGVLLIIALVEGKLFISTSNSPNSERGRYHSSRPFQELFFEILGVSKEEFKEKLFGSARTSAYSHFFVVSHHSICNASKFLKDKVIYLGNKQIITPLSSPNEESETLFFKKYGFNSIEVDFSLNVNIESIFEINPKLTLSQGLEHLSRGYFSIESEFTSEAIIIKKGTEIYKIVPLGYKLRSDIVANDNIRLSLHKLKNCLVDKFRENFNDLAFISPDGFLDGYRGVTRNFLEEMIKHPKERIYFNCSKPPREWDYSDESRVDRFCALIFLRALCGHPSQLKIVLTEGLKLLDELEEFPVLLYNNIHRIHTLSPDDYQINSIKKGIATLVGRFSKYYSNILPSTERFSAEKQRDFLIGKIRVFLWNEADGLGLNSNQLFNAIRFCFTSQIEDESSTTLLHSKEGSNSPPVERNEYRNRKFIFRREEFPPIGK